MDGEEDARAGDRSVKVLRAASPSVDAPMCACVLVCIPVDCAVVLAPRSIFSVEFDAGEDTLFTANATHELDNTDHAAGDVDGVADVDILAVCAHSVGWRGAGSYEC